MAEQFPRLRLEDLIFLLGMPRSGTTWISQIFEMVSEVVVRLSPNYSYALKNRLSVKSTEADWIEVLRRALSTDDPFMTQDWKRERGELEWIEKDFNNVHRLAIKDTRYHDVYIKGMEIFPAAKCLYIVRHPCGHLNSWRTSSEFPDDAEFSTNWRNGACRKSDGPGEYWGFDDWKALTQRYLAQERQNPERFKVFRFETLVEDPIGTTENLFRFVGLELHDDVVSFLNRSHASHDPNANSVFRSPKVASRWRSEFPKEIAAQIYADLRGTELEIFL